MLGLLTIPMGTSVPMPICQRPLCIMLRCRIWRLCDWHSLGRDPVGRPIFSASLGTAHPSEACAWMRQPLVQGQRCLFRQAGLIVAKPVI